TVVDADGLRRITLVDAARRNALSMRMMTALTEAIAAAGADPEVRVVILAAEGPAFSAGHDLKELTAARAASDRGRAFFEETMRTCAGLMLAIVRCPKPVIAEVAGVATAAGCQLVASCDLAVAAEGARFATPGVHIGLFCSTPMVALSRNLSRKHAMEMLLTGAMVDAEEARRLGLVNRVVAPDVLTAETETLAAVIASKSPLTLKIGKEAFYAQAEMSLSDAYEFTARVMVENMLTRDAEEGISAFVEKRHPVWEGR
ncbi:MAG: enoyl-CoA hydratase, partial [Phyllobacteriaceae bacterium]|nr:enoyl-CoA hydratase [Phyllobacteriaceae bacterium]